MLMSVGVDAIVLGHCSYIKNLLKRKKLRLVTLLGRARSCHDDDLAGVSGDNRPVAPHSTDSDHRSASRHHPALRCIFIPPLC